MWLTAVTGYKNSGKTALCMDLIAGLKEKGFSVGFIKHTHDQDHMRHDAMTDTGRALSSGCDTLLWSPKSLRFESPEAEVSPISLAGRFFPEADIVIIEGGKNLNMPKIWVVGGGKREDAAGIPGVYAFYERGGSDLSGLVSLIASKAAECRRSSSVFIDGKPLYMKNFIADFVGGSIAGMLRSLKGVENLEKINVFVNKIKG